MLWVVVDRAGSPVAGIDAPFDGEDLEDAERELIDTHFCEAHGLSQKQIRGILRAAGIDVVASSPELERILRRRSNV